MSFQSNLEEKTNLILEISLAMYLVRLLGKFLTLLRYGLAQRRDMRETRQCIEENQGCLDIKMGKNKILLFL